MKKISFYIGKREIQFLHIASAAMIISGIALLVWFFVHANYRTSAWADEEFLPAEATIVCTPRVIDGVCVTPGHESPRLVAVMIENHLDARPQSGLSHAAVVYEAPVEGNYSRFMAIFPLGQEVDKVGPVRSARPYFLDWAREFGKPMYMHVGGSPDALQELRSSTYFDFNEFSRGSYFWRSRDRYAPHNVYTSSEEWSRGWEDFGSEEFTVSEESWLYDEVVSCITTCATSIVVSFAPPVYQAEWKYSTTTEKYMRYQLKKPHVDQDGTQISADTLVVQYVKTTVLDAELRIEMDTIGSGDAMVFTKGNIVEGTWKKISKDSKTRFYDSTGTEIPFTPGKIWIEVVNQVGDLEWK